MKMICPKVKSYIERDGKYLLLHRVKKKQDVNEGKWVGIGGHFLPEESPDECLLREVRENSPLCDIVLTVPHDADADTATAMLALAEHYGLISVDLRAAFASGEGLLHTEGPDLGYPTVDGHRAYADAILEAILEAADEGHLMKALPNERLY